MNENNAANFRRSLAGLCLILGPLLLLVGSIVAPEGAKDDTEYLQNVADATDGAEWGAALGILGLVLVAAGIVGLVSAIQERGAMLANVAMIFAYLGMTCFVALATTGYFDVALVENLSIEQAEKVMNGAEDNLDGFIPILICALLGTLIGFILLAIALFRSRIVPVFVPALIVIGLVLLVMSEESKALSIAASAALAAGYGVAGLTLLRGRDDGAPAAGPPPAAPPPAV